MRDMSRQYIASSILHAGIRRGFFMRTFISGGVYFYFLSPGDKVAEPDGGFIGAYTIWQREDDKWDVRYCLTGKWEVIAQQHFQTEKRGFQLRS